MRSSFDTVLDKFLKTMQTTAARLQEKLLRPDVRQKGKEQVKEKARDSRSATAEPLAGRTGAAESICSLLRKKRKFQKHEVMFIEQRSQRTTQCPEPLLM